MSTHKKVLLVTGYCLLVTFFIGCATLTDIPKGFWGVSTRVLEENRKDALVKKFNYDFNACYNRTLEILKNISAYIYAQDKKRQLIAIYVSEEDTTPVGIFFVAQEADITCVEITSPSIYAKEIIAKRVFALLEGLPDPLKKKEEDERQE